MIHLKYLILETPYTFFIYSVGILVLHTLNTLSPVFSGINNNNVSFLAFPFFPFYIFKKENIYFQIFLALI